MIDRNSQSWRAIEAHIAQRIEKLLALLEQPQDELTTAGLRASIAELRGLTRLGLSDYKEPNPGLTPPAY